MGNPCILLTFGLIGNISKAFIAQTINDKQENIQQKTCLRCPNKLPLRHTLSSLPLSTNKVFCHVCHERQTVQVRQTLIRRPISIKSSVYIHHVLPTLWGIG